MGSVPREAITLRTVHVRTVRHGEELRLNALMREYRCLGFCNLGARRLRKVEWNPRPVKARSDSRNYE